MKTERSSGPVYDEIARILAQDPVVRYTVEGGMKRFGASGELRAGGKMFAFAAKGNLIVKLPQWEVAAIVADGRGQPCTMGRRTMREWVIIGPDRESEWLPLVIKSKNFVLGNGTT